MPDAMTTGGLVALALSQAAKSALGELGKDAYRKLKEKAASWASDDVNALVDTPDSKGRQAVLAEIVDSRPSLEQAEVLTLAELLLSQMGVDRNYAVIIPRLKAGAAKFGNVSTENAGGLILVDADIGKTFEIGDIEAKGRPGKR